MAAASVLLTVSLPYENPVPIGWSIYRTTTVTERQVNNIFDHPERIHLRLVTLFQLYGLRCVLLSDVTVQGPFSASVHERDAVSDRARKMGLTLEESDHGAASRT